MPAPTIVASDLLISDTRITQITNALRNTTITDPISVEITRQIDKVDSYTSQYVLAANRYKRLVRALVMYELYATGSLGTPPADIKPAYEAAMKELEDIRDGKFDDLELADPADTGVGEGGNWGSETKI